MAAPSAPSALLMLALLPLAVSAANVDSTQGRGHSLRRDAGNAIHDTTQSFVRAMEFQHRLRVCNAYPYSSAMQVYRGEKEDLTSDVPMAYKTCRDFSTQLKSGDKLEFKIRDMTAGTFAISDLPSSDAVLLLVIHRHDTLSTAVSFESHVFANLANAQVAVIDAYKGSAKAKPLIRDQAGHGNSRTEELRYNTVVAVNQGKYDVVLDGEDGKEKSRSELVAVSRGSYVVIRTGVEAQQGESFPEELVVFPQSDPLSLHSGAAAEAVAHNGLVAALVALAVARVAA